MRTKSIAVYVANSTRLTYLDVRGIGYLHLNGFHARRLILFKIRIYVRNNMRYWIRYLAAMTFTCLNVTLCNIISLNISSHFLSSHKY